MESILERWGVEKIFGLVFVLNFVYIVKISSYIIIRYKSILGGRNSIKFLDWDDFSKFEEERMLLWLE